MSAPGIGNATAGALTANALKSIFTNQNEKPATKGDIIALGNKINRYQKVLNLPFGPDGSQPHFDMETKKIVYFKNHMITP
ncbi:MAG: hypothetical protein ACI815_000142 [Psychroserpens sp.]|jgi:hypothetical protein